MGAFPPTPQPPQGAPAGGQPPGANPVGKAVSGPSGQPQIANLVQRFKTGLQDIMMFSKAVRQANPQAADQFDQGIQAIMTGIKALTGGQASATSPQGAVPPPPQMAAESPAAETPEAT
jgi:hypothetical protein